MWFRDGKADCLEYRYERKLQHDICCLSYVVCGAEIFLSFGAKKEPGKRDSGRVLSGLPIQSIGRTTKKIWTVRSFCWAFDTLVLDF